MAEEGSSNTFFYADEDVFIGKKRTKREIIKSTLMGQNYESPVTKSSTSSSCNLPDVISISSDKNSTDYNSLSSVSHNYDTITISDDDDGNEENLVEVGGTAKQTPLYWEPSSKEAEPLGAVGLSIDALIEASEKLEALAMDPVEDMKLNVVGKPSLNDSVSKDLDYSLLTGVSESVLDISHGSSLPSPAVEHNDSSLGLLAMAVYEDISCDGDHMFDTSEKQPKAEVNLHMSVDETDHMTLGLDEEVVGGSDVTQPTFYKSCLSEFSNSVYTTANNTEDLAVCKQPSSTFSDYRDTLDDSCDLEGVNIVNFKYEDNDNMKETSFEIVMNNRQNSFASTVSTATKTENTSEKTKPFISKLPVYNNCPSNILKPSLLQGNLDSKLKARNFKWSKTLPKPCETKPKNTNFQIKTLVKTSAEKVSNSEQPKQKTLSKSLSIQKPKIIQTPSKFVLGQSTCNNSKTPRKAPVNELIPKSSSTNKTSDKRALCQSPKLPNSDAKTPKTLLGGVRPPINHLLSSGKRNENKNLVLDRYKNVISPIRAYINNSPIAIQRRMHVPEEQVILMDHSARKAESHIPKPVSTPLSGSKIKTSSATCIPVSKVAQKLFCNKKTQDQENVDPNYARDTLPPRFFEAAAAVFMKEPEPPKRHLPKVGESMMKLIDTPRPKVIVHQGRVKESPKAKGMLIPAINVVPATPDGLQATTDTRISIRMVKSADESDN